MTTTYHVPEDWQPPRPISSLSVCAAALVVIALCHIGMFYTLVLIYHETVKHRPTT